MLVILSLVQLITQLSYKRFDEFRERMHNDMVDTSVRQDVRGRLYIVFREPILRITDTSDGTFMACSQDGLMSFWTANMELKRTRSVQVP